MNAAPSAPSTTRWSADSVAVIIWAVCLLTVAPRVYRFVTSPKALPRAAAPAPKTSGGQPGAAPTKLFPDLAGDELRAALHDYAAVDTTR